jgi:hypothetical protein
MAFRFEIKALITSGELTVETVQHVVELVKRFLVEDSLRISICVPSEGFPSITSPRYERISLRSILLRLADT